MKQKFFAVSAVTVAVCATFFVSCNPDSDFLGGDDLSINSQVPMTRANSEQFVGDINKIRRQTPVYEDECGLFALTEVRKRDRNAFTVEYDTQTASEYYDRLKQRATDSCGYQGGAMNADDMLFVGQQFGLLTGRTMFNGGNQSEEYFNQSDNIKKARIVCFQKKGKGHYAKIDRIRNNKVEYVDSEGTGSVNINEIDGVMYYEKK